MTDVDRLLLLCLALLSSGCGPDGRPATRTETPRRLTGLSTDVAALRKLPGVHSVEIARRADQPTHRIIHVLFATADFDQWDQFSRGFLLLLMFIGGSAGSTSGGLKVIRMLLFMKIIPMEAEQKFRPNLVRPLRLGGEAVDASIRHDVVVYISLSFVIAILATGLLATIEPDTQWQQEGRSVADKLLDCFSAVAATFNTAGPGLGVLGPTQNYAGFSAAGKVLLMLVMLLGRLELFPILVLFAPGFWRQQ